MTRFDWAGLMRAGQSRGLSPRLVWAMTPAELAFVLGLSGGGPSLTRSRLEELAAAFPDRKKENRDGER